ncbi:MAG: uncharacterized protein JWM20_186 [Patescibacteria group bacterium]|nr:uncharacterized protein [Patescibacteria group bacterium]
MKIKEVKISNILSFAEKADFNTSPSDIIFGDALNIIVGANGSGKSNFVEILFTLFQIYFVEPYDYEPAYDTDRSKNPRYLKKKENTRNGLRLDKHNLSSTKNSYLELKIELNESDRKNLEFIKANFAIINEISRKYAQGLLNVSAFPIETTNISTISNVSFKFKLDNGQPRLVFSLEPDGTDEQKIVNFYLKNFDLFKKLIIIGTERESKNWDELVISFEFLGAQRFISSFPPQINFNTGQENQVGNLEDGQKGVNIKNSSDSGHIFNIPFTKVGNKIAKDSYGSLSVPDSITKQFTATGSLLHDINNMLDEYLGLKVRYREIPPPSIKAIVIEIYTTKNGRVMDFNQLSSGQKSIFSLIFLVMGLEIKNGLLVIDEPEIHLHPKLQKKYFNLLKRFSNDYGLQSILITHSPVFIDEKTIKNTYRFYVENSATNIVQGNVVTSSEEDLIKFLNYTNSAKIFFTNKVILVEGETDNYFYSYFLNKAGKSDEDFEFLSINGKHEYKKWFDFLDKLKIKSAFITDFDFLEQFSDLGIETAKEEILLSGLDADTITRVKSTLSQSGTKITADLFNAMQEIKDKDVSAISQDEINQIKDIWYFLYKKRIPFSKIISVLTLNPAVILKIKEKIINLRAIRVFVLSYGAIETYLQFPSKGLQEVVDYCSNDNLSTMHTDHKADLDDIFTNVLSL